MMMTQHTIAATMTFKGTGLHSGAPVTMHVHPAPVDHGIAFQRADLKDKPVIKGHADFSHPVPLNTTLTDEQGNSIKTIEHVMSALAAANVDNALIVVDGPEIPLLDGSSIDYWLAIEETSVVPQSAARHYIEILEPVEVTEGDKWARLVPDVRRRFQMTIDFAHPLIRQQTFRFDVDNGDYAADVAPARTFGFQKDFNALLAAGLIKGGSMDNAVVFDDNSVANPEGLRFADEPARHKLLDAIGDTALAGKPIIGRYEGFKASHALNTRLVQALLDDPASWRLTTRDHRPANMVDIKAGNAATLFSKA